MLFSTRFPMLRDDFMLKSHVVTIFWELCDNLVLKIVRASVPMMGFVKRTHQWRFSFSSFVREEIVEFLTGLNLSELFGVTRRAFLFPTPPRFLPCIIRLIGYVRKLITTGIMKVSPKYGIRQLKKTINCTRKYPKMCKTVILEMKTTHYSLTATIVDWDVCGLSHQLSIF